MKQDQSAKYANASYKGPYIVSAIYDNGTVRIDMGIVSAHMTYVRYISNGIQHPSNETVNHGGVCNIQRSAPIQSLFYLAE